MRFRVVPGKNFKTFIVMSEITSKLDFELYDIVKKVLSRSEYKPFLQGFNKTIDYSYLYNEYIFPAQFWGDVYKQIKNFSDSIYLEDEELIYNNEVSRDEFDEWVRSLKLPPELVIDAEEYKFQQDSVFEAIHDKCARIEVATSGGKTFITYLYTRFLIEHNYIPEDKKILIVVPSKLLASQLKDDWKEYDRLMERKISVETIFSGAKKILFADVVCGTFQSLGNYEQEYFDDFSAFICDEVHRAKSYTIRNEIYAKMLFAEYCFAMTGTTPAYNTLDYLHIVSMFGREVVRRTAAENIADGVSTPIKIQAIKINYIDDKDYSLKLIEQGIIGVEKYKIEKEYFHNNNKRTKLIGKLLNAYTGNTLILVDTVEYCDILRDYLTEFCDSDWTFEIIHGKINNREEIIEMMRQTKDHYCIIATYGTMSTGVSIKNIMYIYFPDGGKSDVRIRQSIGRGMRLFPTKEYCTIFDFQDMMMKSAFKNHAAERNRIYLAQKFPVKYTIVEI